MKKYLLVLLSVSMFLLIGCGSNKVASSVNAAVFTSADQTIFTNYINDMTTGMESLGTFTSTINDLTLAFNLIFNVGETIEVDGTDITTIAGDKYNVSITKSGDTFTATFTLVLNGTTETNTVSGTDLNALLND